MSEGPGRKDEPGLVKAGRLMAFGLEFGFTVAAGVIVGYYLDGWLGTAPLFTLLISIGALAGALYRLTLTLKQFQ